MKDVRQEYHAAGLNEDDLLDDPIEQARLWVQEAIDAQLPMPNAMTLATVSPQGQPSTRIVLLKGVEQGRFQFFTDYDSRKGREIAANANVSCTFFWPQFDRQLTVLGQAVPLSREASQAYFASRPYESQISAAVSPQSRPVSRDWLEQEVAALKASYPQPPVPCPQTWGGYGIVPEEIHFWHGRPSRLHDRLVFVRDALGLWQKSRLAP